MGVEIYILVLLAFMILGAIVAVETKTLLSSVISLGAVGVGVSIAFLFLGAPDLAIVQVAVEVVMLILFIRATIGREVIPTRGRIPWPALVAAVALMAGFAAFASLAFLQWRPFGEPVMSAVPAAPASRYLEKGLAETGAPNIVTAIILDYRAYDTLGEATVIFTAIIGTLAILRGRAKRGRGK